MPAQYAHLRFGRQAMEQVPPDLRKQLERFRSLFETGLQGPDPFFFYNPLFHTSIGALGHRFHMQTGKEFFGRCIRTLRRDPSDAARTYVFGLLGHYALDSNCHPFVCRIHDGGKINHSELETEFDRFLMARDGIAHPHLHSLSDHLRPTPGECATAAAFFPPATPRSFRRSIRNMTLVQGLLTTRHRSLARKLMGLAGKGPSLMVMTEGPSETCAQLDETMLQLYHKALESYPILAAQLTAAMDSGAALGQDFDPIFH